MTTNKNMSAKPRPRKTQEPTTPANGAELPGDAVPVFTVSYRKPRQSVLKFPDRRVRFVQPKTAALQTVADHQDELASFADPSSANAQPVKAVEAAKQIMIEILPYMVPDTADREFVLNAFDDERIEDVEFISILLKQFTFLMGSLSAAAAMAESPDVTAEDTTPADTGDSEPPTGD